MSSKKVNLGSLEKAMGKTIEESTRDSDKTILTIEEKIAVANSVLSQQGQSAEHKNEEIKEKTRVIRKNISFPVFDYKLLDKIKNRFLKMGIELNHSEIVRIGLILLNELPDEQFELTEKSIKRLKVTKIID